MGYIANLESKQSQTRNHGKKRKEKEVKERINTSVARTRDASPLPSMARRRQTSGVYMYEGGNLLKKPPITFVRSLATPSQRIASHRIESNRIAFCPSLAAKACRFSVDDEDCANPTRSSVVRNTTDEARRSGEWPEGFSEEV